MGNHAEPNEVSGYSTGNYAGYQPDQHTDDHNDTGRTVAPTTVGCWKQGEGCTGNPDTDSSHAPVVSDDKVHENAKIINDNVVATDSLTCGAPMKVDDKVEDAVDVVESDSDMTVDLQSSEETSKIEGFANTKMSNKTMMMILFAMILIGGIIFMMRKKKMAASAAPVAPVV